jgi:hypothetical protein
MDIEYIREQLKEIESSAGWDFEDAHCRQDALFEEVLREIAKGHADSQRLASEVLRALEIDFPRYCA